MGFAETADAAIYLLGVATLCSLVAKAPGLWRLHVKPWWSNLRYGLRFDLVEKDDDYRGFRIED